MHFKTKELIDTDSLLMYPFGPLVNYSCSQILYQL